jgi:hypothetical protein
VEKNKNKYYYQQKKMEFLLIIIQLAVLITDGMF